ncbi:DMT family transporter [Tropicibacter sp. R15_0]|uniref:DMT family transporter n=1 Tax=Tropicibacter sp. R15_0 TaxID=2821101 RepID=UPI001ADB8C2D|nr:DMT family transporter [Tropicibacter sp. R15_0]MBO9465463.1 DMT family transporter [Tropicibacter sp. R15_0]
MTHYALTMLAAGIGIPVLAALNAALGVRLGSPVSAAMILFFIAILSTSLVWFTLGRPSLTEAVAAPKHLFLAGVLIAFYVLSITFVAPKFGVGNAVFFVLLGQLISTAAIDHFGLFGAKVTPLNLMRATGISVMVLGVWITQRA